MSAPLVIAHRGNTSVAPENTLPGLASAILAGADMIEIDVRASADGQGVVIHDATVDRTGDATGEVGEMTWADIARVDAGSALEPAFAGARIPSFAEVLELLGRHRAAHLLVELKDPFEAGALAQTLGSIDAAGLAERVVLQSFYPDLLRVCAHVAPQIPRGFLTVRTGEEVLQVCRELDVVACNPAHRLIQDDPGLVGRWQREGWQVMAWTANEPADWHALMEAGVDGIITDRPDRLRGWLAGRAA